MRRTITGAASLALSLAVACGEETRQASDAGPPDAATAPDFCSVEVPCSLVSGEASNPPEFLSPVGDVDRYAIDVAVGQIIDVRVQMSAPRSRVQLRATLFEPGNPPTQVAQGQWSGSPSQAQQFSFQHVSDQAGTYFIDVRDVGNDDDDDIRNYIVTATLIDQTDDNEPNDTPAQATPLAIDVPATGQIASVGDEDWFSVEVPNDQILQIRPTFPGGGELNLQWELYAASEPGVSLAESITIGPTQNRAVGKQGGTYLLRVFDAGGGSSSELAYQMRVLLLAEPDANDVAGPNEEPGSATSVGFGSREGLIAATSDFDYYAVDISGASEADPVILDTLVEWVGAPSSTVQLQFTLRNDQGDLVCPGGDDGCLSLRRFNDGSFTEVRCHDNESCRHAIPITRNGRYYVLVQDFQDDAYDESARYRITFSEVILPADDDENFSNAARPVQILTSTAAETIEYAWVEGYISYVGDVDTYVIQFPQPPYADTQNGDWEWSVDFLVPGPSAVEYSAVIDAPDRANTGNIGRNPIPNCGDVPPGPGNLDPCNAPDSQNFHDFQRGALSPMCVGSDDSSCCQVIFRQSSDGQGGQWFFQVRDASTVERTTGGPAGDDYDVRPSAKYRFRLRARAGCQVPGPCAGRFIEPNAGDRCGRP